MKAQIVIGLGFGDEGKGNFTNYLCTQHKNPIVIRFSGGQQAGHTVIHNGIKHIFSNYGSGELQNIPTYFTEHCCIYLNTLEEERKVLYKKGIIPRLSVHPLTKITTPYDVAYGRIREGLKGHGSCGLGIGSTMHRNSNSGYKLYAIDFINKEVLQAKLLGISNYYRKLAEKLDILEGYNNQILSQEETFFNLIDSNLFNVTDYDMLLSYETLIFEGSQGIMLDKDHGIFPNVTYANTTSKNAIEICNKFNLVPNVNYITRCYQTRHGNGWMSNTSPVTLCNNEEEINVVNRWQGEFKSSELDYELLNYALRIDSLYNNKSTKSLVITCLDQLPEFKFEYDKLNRYFRTIYNSYSPESTKIKLLT